MLLDRVPVRDVLFSRLGKEAVRILDGETKGEFGVTGYVTINAFDSTSHKKIPSLHREGKNTWVFNGREYLPLLMSYASDYPDLQAFRNDRIKYIGLGKGAFTVTPSVERLQDPIPYTLSGEFLALVDIPPEFPRYPARSTVRYTHTYIESDIVGENTKQTVTEAGLYTDGSDYDIPGGAPMWFPGSRQTGIDVAGKQKPCAYQAFEPILKTDQILLQLIWEVRF